MAKAKAEDSARARAVMLAASQLWETDGFDEAVSCVAQALAEARERGRREQTETIAAIILELAGRDSGSGSRNHALGHAQALREVLANIMPLEPPPSPTPRKEGLK